MPMNSRLGVRTTLSISVCTQHPTPTKPRASKRITLRQANNLMEAVAYAREIGTPLNAHATIHWVGTKVGDDPDGRLFAKVREGLDKWLRRQGIPGGLTAIWVRERLSGGSAEVVHCHMLFHLPHPFMRGRKRKQVEEAFERLIDRHGDGNYADYTLKLTFPPNPNGIYLLKGGGPDVWRRFGVPRRWRKPQGFIHGKRCGTTENIGRAPRTKQKIQQEKNDDGFGAPTSNTTHHSSEGEIDDSDLQTPTRARGEPARGGRMG
jgi:hypothetical protein